MFRPLADEQAAYYQGRVLAQGQLAERPRNNATVEGREITLGGRDQIIGWQVARVGSWLPGCERAFHGSWQILGAGSKTAAQLVERRFHYKITAL